MNSFEEGVEEQLFVGGGGGTFGKFNKKLLTILNNPNAKLF